MRCGVSLTAMNYSAWPAFERWEATGEWGPPPVPDHEVLREDVEIGLLCDALGYDSLWTVEHHATPYNMVTSTVQLLTYFAGATSNVDFGTMVIVLPWHHPVRVAEDIAMLHNLLGESRSLTIGIGRGAGRREFRALDIPMDESRERFLESLAIIRGLLGQEVFSFEGTHYTVPEMSIRPRPRDGQSLVEDIHCAWGSAQTIPIAAEAGVKPLVIPQKGWDAYVQDLEEFNGVRAANGLDAAQPVVALTVFCADTEAEAEAGAKQYFTEYADAAIRSYELAGQHFATTKGYEAYAANASATHDALTQKIGQTYVDSHVWGTPDMCIEKIRAVTELLRPSEIVALPRVGSMPFDVASANVKLFAEEVLPAVHEIEVAV
jgi:alkanesulfonate monooxygenase SsuD/methylene tetrahydromethanopterin reductase-like flavin-dependent oxidoreductase (luciferase family)